MPILRAGLGMAEAMLNVLPGEAGSRWHLSRRENISADKLLFQSSAPCRTVRCLSLIPCSRRQQRRGRHGAAEVGRREAHSACRPAGCVTERSFREQHPDVPVFLAALDEKLNERAYIVPGLATRGIAIATLKGGRRGKGSPDPSCRRQSFVS